MRRTFFLFFSAHETKAVKKEKTGNEPTRLQPTVGHVPAEKNPKKRERRGETYGQNTRGTKPEFLPVNYRNSTNPMMSRPSPDYHIMGRSDIEYPPVGGRACRPLMYILFAGRASHPQIHNCEELWLSEFPKNFGYPNRAPVPRLR